MFYWEWLVWPDSGIHWRTITCLISFPSHRRLVFRNSQRLRSDGCEYSNREYIIFPAYRIQIPPAMALEPCACSWRWAPDDSLRQTTSPNSGIHQPLPRWRVLRAQEDFRRLQVKCLCTVHGSSRVTWKCVVLSTAIRTSLDLPSTSRLFLAHFSLIFCSLLSRPKPRMNPIGTGGTAAAIPT